MGPVDDLQAEVQGHVLQFFAITGRVSYRIFRKGRDNHLVPPTYQETVPITNVLTATPLEKF